LEVKAMSLALETLVRDLQMGLRGLRRRPALLTLGAITLAIGFAGNMTVFSILDSLLLRPYPFADLERLALVREVRAGSSQEQLRLTPGDFLDLSEEVSSFESVAPSIRGAQSGRRRRSESVRGLRDAEPFRSWGRARAGRFFDGRGETGAARVALLSHGLVTRRFPDGSDILGSEITLNGEVHTVVGLMPENLNYPRAVDVFVPLVLTPSERVERSVPSPDPLPAAPGVALETANSARRSDESRRRYPDSHREKLSPPEASRRAVSHLPMFSMLQIAGFSRSSSRRPT
jgi:putative ABC transport system permease protein